MNPYRRFFLAASLWGMMWCAAAQAVAPPVQEGDEEDIPAPSATPAPGEQYSPEALSARLAYAQSLAEDTGGDCHQRLEDARTNLAIVTASPAFPIVVPTGPARVANVEYRLHLGSAICGHEAAPDAGELQIALDAARRALDLYHDAWDYQSVAILQFDIAATYRLSGDKVRAVSALEAAIALDRDYGFRKDAEDNTALLLGWKDQPSGPEQVAALLSDFPSRTVSLKFAWAARDVEVTRDVDFLDLIEDKPIHSSASTMLTRHIRADGTDWVTSSEAADKHYDFSEWPGEGARGRERTTLIRAGQTLVLADLKVAGKGEFKALVDPSGIAAKLADEEIKLTENLSPDDEAQSSRAEQLAGTVKMFSPADGIEGKAAEDYDLLTGSWIDATLEQGVWYDMTSPLFLPGTAIYAPYDIQFAFTRFVPCDASSATASCVEILVHSIPNPETLRAVLTYAGRAFRLPRGRAVHYESATNLRIVTDPDHLLPALFETRRYWSIAVDDNESRVVGSEKSVTTFHYHP